MNLSGNATYDIVLGSGMPLGRWPWRHKHDQLPRYVLWRYMHDYKLMHPHIHREYSPFYFNSSILGTPYVPGQLEYKRFIPSETSPSQYVRSLP